MTEEQAPPRRPIWPGWRAIAIGGAVAVAGISALVTPHGTAPPGPRFAVGVAELENAPARAAVDPLMAELLRCRSLPAGSDDVTCREAWEVNRRRFMGESRTYVAPVAPDVRGER